MDGARIINKYKFFALPIVTLIFFVYRPWFTGGAIIGGDWPYYWKDSLSQMNLWPSLWAPWQGNGLGGTNPLLGLHLFQSLLIIPLVNWFGLPWEIVYKIGWFGLFITLSIIGSKKLWEVVNYDSGESFPWWVLPSLIYTTNTYILMVTGGGQMGVALAYAVAPLVLSSFIKLLKSISYPVVKVKSQKSKVKSLLCTGLLLGFQVMIDPRIAYVTMMGVGIYLVSNVKCQMSNVISTLVVPLVIAAGINAFWVVPMGVMKNNPLENLGLTYTSIDALKFFSFADFPHALSLLHPNWPENLFGKTYFLRPEFLVLPFLVFSSLLFWRKEKNIFFFVFLGLTGVFLSKGAKEPFGTVYQWIFTHVPGFVMFRDPTKFYVLIALAYSVLIPFTLKQLAELKFTGKTLLIALFILFWLFTTREAVFGKLGGTFVEHAVPKEYRELEHFLQGQPIFARTLWVPRQQRFSYGTLDHMPVEAEPLFGATTAAELKTKLDEPTSMDFLADLGIGYIMIPYDSLGELFLTDRKYDEKKRKAYEMVLDSVAWLTKIRSGNLTVYQASQHRDLFWLTTNEKITYKRVRPDQYTVSFTAGTPATVYFSQRYHPGWVLHAGNRIVNSQRSPQGLNSFQIQGPGTYEGVVEFEPQKYVTWGMILSLLTVLGVVLIFMI